MPTLSLGGSTSAPRSNLRGIYWKKVSSSLPLDGSVWSTAATLLHSNGPSELLQFDADEIESAFGTRPSSLSVSMGGSSGSVTARGSGQAHVALLDTKRATNCGIALARLGMPHGGALTRAILQMDEEKLCLSKATSLLTVVPTAEEAELIRGYDGDVSLLGSTERYFAELLTIPRLTARLQAWVVKQRFAGLVADLLERQQRLSGALALLVTSEPLHTALGLLLALGNKLNAGTARGNAPAIRVESLSQLGSSSRSSASSVVGFLVRHVQRVSPELLGQIQTATQALAPCCRLDAAEMSNELNALTSDLQRATSALKVHEQAVAAAEATRLASRAESEQAKTAAAAAKAAKAWVAKEEAKAKEADDDFDQQSDEFASAVDRMISMAEGAAEAEAEEAEEAEAGAADADRFCLVMRAFVDEADGALAELNASASEMSAAAKHACTFFCEREDTSVGAAHMLLVRVHTFGAAIGSAYELAEAERVAAEAKRSKVTFASPAGGTTPGSSKKASATANNNSSEFVASSASLRSILEDDDGEPQEGGGAAATTPSLSKQRRMTAPAKGSATPADDVLTSPEELAKLFARRASGMSMSGRLADGKGSTATVTDAPRASEPSPSKRPRSMWQDAD